MAILVLLYFLRTAFDAISDKQRASHVKLSMPVTLCSALAEVVESFKEQRVSRVAIDDALALGWIGGIQEYNGHVWELHPLVVKPSEQRRGIGAALVADFERCVLARGGETVMLGADDETNATSLGGVDLYPEVTQHIRTVKNLKGHPF